jgi:hypothetical protein
MLLSWLRPPPPSRDPLLLVALGLVAVTAGVTAYASVRLLGEVGRWRRVRNPLEEFLKSGAQALQVPIKAIETTEQLLQDLTTIAKGAVMSEDLQRQMTARRQENQVRADAEAAGRARVQAAKANAEAIAAQARADALKVEFEALTAKGDVEGASRVRIKWASVDADAVGARARADALQIEAEAAAAATGGEKRAPETSAAPPRVTNGEAERRSSATFSAQPAPGRPGGPPPDGTG